MADLNIDDPFECCRANISKEAQEKFTKNIYIGYKLGSQSDFLDPYIVELGDDRINIHPHFRTTANPNI